MRARNHPGVRREDAGDVCVDLAQVRFEGGCERDGRRVRASAPKRGDVPGVGHPLEPGHDWEDAIAERLSQPVAPHLEDACFGVRGVRDDAGLAAREGGGGNTELRQRHAQQRHRDSLAGGEEHVELASRSHPAHVLGEPDEPVGGLAHGAHYDDHVCAGSTRPGYMVSDRAYTLRVADRGSAVLLDDEGHD